MLLLHVQLTGYDAQNMEIMRQLLRTTARTQRQRELLCFSKFASPVLPSLQSVMQGDICGHDSIAALSTNNCALVLQMG